MTPRAISSTHRNMDAVVIGSGSRPRRAHEPCRERRACRNDLLCMDRPMTPPRVSVVLSVYNGAVDLPKAIDTILAQTFSDFELIAINDGSTDGSAAVLDGVRDPRVRVINQDNLGFPAALNRGIALARG